MQKFLFFQLLYSSFDLLYFGLEIGYYSHNFFNQLIQFHCFSAFQNTNNASINYIASFSIQCFNKFLFFLLILVFFFTLGILSSWNAFDFRGFIRKLCIYRKLSFFFKLISFRIFFQYLKFYKREKQK